MLFQLKFYDQNLETTLSNEPLPARMINEFAYCPRLFYLEYVQKEWAESADTLDGSFVHRRVDKETGKISNRLQKIRKFTPVACGLVRKI